MPPRPAFPGKKPPPDSIAAAAQGHTVPCMSGQKPSIGAHTQKFFFVPCKDLRRGQIAGSPVVNIGQKRFHPHQRSRKVPLSFQQQHMKVVLLDNSDAADKTKTHPLPGCLPADEPSPAKQVFGPPAHAAVRRWRSASGERPCNPGPVKRTAVQATRCGALSTPSPLSIYCIHCTRPAAQAQAASSAEYTICAARNGCPPADLPILKIRAGHLGKSVVEYPLQVRV